MSRLITLIKTNGRQAVGDPYHSANLNERRKLGGGERRSNVHKWVSADAKLAAAEVDQLTPLFRKGVNGGFSQNPPFNLCEHDVRLRDPSQPSPY